MKKKSSLKAEDILIDKNFSKATLSEGIGNIEDKSKSEIQIAALIHSFLTSDPTVFPEIEKEQTKSHIRSSIRKIFWKRQFVRLSAAASVLLICAVTVFWYSQLNSRSEILSYAQTVTDTLPDQNTRLILQDGKEIKIGKNESKISYAQNGKDITIGADQTVVQEITLEEPSFNTVIVPYGKRTFITLSEGTKVWLNSGSRLIYPTVFAENMREVYIEGEAVFDVTHSESRPFFVKTRDYDVKVLGTVFNVSSYADDKNSSTVLKEGKVELSYNGSLLNRAKLVIFPGERAVFDPDKKVFTQQKVKPEEYMSWQEGYLVLNSEKLADILKKLTRYYNVEILLQNVELQNETFSGNLDLKNSPAEVLEIIAQTTPFLYSYENNKLVIMPK